MRHFRAFIFTLAPVMLPDQAALNALVSRMPPIINLTPRTYHSAIWPYVLPTFSSVV